MTLAQQAVYHHFVADQENIWGVGEAPFTPGEVLREMLSERGWTQDELAAIIGVSRASITNLITGRYGVTPEMAAALSAAFGNSADEWMKLDAQYRLAHVRTDLATIQRRAKLYEIAPVREMQKRGWISEVDSVEGLERELEKFFDGEIKDEPPGFAAAMRKSGNASDLTPAERAWCFAARKLARGLPVLSFSRSKLDTLANKMRKLAAYPKEARRLPVLLADFGIRFLVVEPIAGAKVDGATFWLSTQEPVIAVSIRDDRVDNFWFTVFHEWAHIKNRDAVSVDVNLVGEEGSARNRSDGDDIERRANEMAASALIKKADLESFIRRVGPFYSRDRIIQFAHTVKIHPGIIVGQLQHRDEIKYGTNRHLLVKIRDAVIETAFTDGWGYLTAQSN
ncbi:MAG: HigA family addiction module antitoxin [Chloroflexota bacterium]